MEIFLQIILLIIGFALLIKGADWLVSGASSVASNFKVSKLLVGLTIVAFGTGAPELAVSFSSLMNLVWPVKTSTIPASSHPFWRNVQLVLIELDHPDEKVNSSIPNALRLDSSRSTSLVW